MRKELFRPTMLTNLIYLRAKSESAEKSKILSRMNNKTKIRHAPEMKMLPVSLFGTSTAKTSPM